MSTTTTVTAADVAAQAALLVGAENSIPVLFTAFAVSTNLCGDSLAKQSKAIRTAGAAKYASTATLNRVQVTGSYLVRDRSDGAIARSCDLYSAVIAAVSAKVGLPAVRVALDGATSIDEAIAAVVTLVSPQVGEVAGDEGEGEGEVDGEGDEVPTDKSLVYLQQALAALVNFTEKGVPTREHEGTLDLIQVQLADAFAKVRALPLPGEVVLIKSGNKKGGKKAA